MATPTTLPLDPDFKDFINLLRSEGVRYLLLGGYAVNYYGFHRMTGDIDFWIAIDEENARRVSTALQKFGFSAASVPWQQFTEAGKIHMFGREPLRVDLLTAPSGVEFETCYARRVVTQIAGVEVDLISLDDLRANKAASARDKDLTDLKKLPAKGST